MASSAEKRTTWYRVKRVFALTQENATPVNTSMALQVLLAMISSAYSMTYAFPFLPDMVKSFGHKEEEKGYYVGIISSAYFGGRIIGSYFWGWLSDKKGPKLVILINCALMAAANVGFGLSVNVLMATIMRFFCGLPSGLVAVLKSVLRDLSDSTNQSFYLSIISLGWAGGMIIGPLAGGYLSNPVSKYPSVFHGVAFFHSYPYFLSCALSSALFVAAFIVISFKWNKKATERRKEITLDDTEVEMGEVKKLERAEIKDTDDTISSLPDNRNRGSPETKHKQPATEVELHENPKQDPDVKVKLLEHSSQSNDDSNNPRNTVNKTYMHAPIVLQSVHPNKVDDTDTPHVRSRVPTVKFSDDASRDLTSESSLLKTLPENKRAEPSRKDTVSSENERDEVKPCSVAWFRKISTWNACRLLSIPTYRGSVFIYAITSFINIGFDALFTVWASTEIRLHGLNFEPHEIGRFISIAALPLAILQVYAFPKLEIRFGAKKTFIGFGYVCIVFMPIVAASRILLPYPAALWGCLLTIHAVNVFAESILFSSVTLFINNSVPVSIVGSANGMSMMAASITRLFSPTVCGSVFAWSVTGGKKIGFPFDVNFMFIVLGAMYWLCNVLCVMLPDSVNGTKKKSEQDK